MLLLNKLKTWFLFFSGNLPAQEVDEEFVFNLGDPNCLWTSHWLYLLSAKISLLSLTIPTAVSSQLVSMPKYIVLRIFYLCDYFVTYFR